MKIKEQFIVSPLLGILDVILKYIVDNGSQNQKNTANKICKKAFARTGIRFRVKDFIENWIVEDTSFLSQMTPCCGKIYTFFPVEEKENWFKSIDSKEVEGWHWHISWLEEI